MAERTSDVIIEDAEMKNCEIEGCQKSQKSLTRSWCGKHYRRWQRNGNPLLTKAASKEPNICAVCRKTFIPKRLTTAIYCSQYCNTRQWRAKNRDYYVDLRAKHRRWAGVPSKDSEEYRKKISDWMKDRYVGENHPRWKGGHKNHLMHNKNRIIMKRGAKGSHTLEEWGKLKENFSYRCLCCKKSEPDISLTEDHITPLSKGGTNYISNIQPLCKLCNSKKYISNTNYITSERVAI